MLFGVSPPNPYHSPFTCFWNQPGVLGMYRGLSATLVAMTPFIAVQQASYDFAKGVHPDCGRASRLPLAIKLVRTARFDQPLQRTPLLPCVQTTLLSQFEWLGIRKRRRRRTLPSLASVASCQALPPKPLPYAATTPFCTFVVSVDRSSACQPQ